MFSKQETKQNLRGILEIAIFMKTGFERIETDKARMLRSFIWPLSILPLILLTSVMLSDTRQSASLLLTLHGARIFISFAICLSFVLLFCKQYDRLEHLYKYITVTNWFEIAMLTLTLPLFTVLASGFLDVEEVKNYAIFVTLVSYIYAAFILTHTLKIPWELGGFLAISFMLINDIGMDLLNLFLKDSL